MGFGCMSGGVVYQTYQQGIHGEIWRLGECFKVNKTLKKIV